MCDPLKAPVEAEEHGGGLLCSGLIRSRSEWDDDIVLSPPVHGWPALTQITSNIIYRVIYSRREEKKQSIRHIQCTIHDSSPLKDPYCRTIIPSPNTQLHHSSLILLSPTVGAKVPKAASHRDRDGGERIWIWGSSLSKTKRHFICGETRELDGIFFGARHGSYKTLEDNISLRLASCVSLWYSYYS